MSAEIIPLIKGGAGKDGWEDPIPLIQTKLPSLSPSILPTWARDYATALAAFSQVAPETAINAVLGTVSTVAQRNLQVQIKAGHKKPLCTWSVTFLQSGNRKSAVMNTATRPLDAYEREKAEETEQDNKRIASKIATEQARIKHLRQEFAKEKNGNKRNALEAKIEGIEEDAASKENQPPA